MYYSNNKRPGSTGRRTTFSRGSFASPRRSFKKDYIDPSKFIRIAKDVAEDIYVPMHSFNDFEINSLLKTNLQNKGFTDPTPIQDQTIPVGLQGKDVLGIANTGTGKTAAFAIPMLEKLLEDKNACALIMAPTRELAQQIEDECRSIAKGSGIYGALLIGGVPMGPQLKDLKFNPRIIIGTPGRIKDHFEQRTLDLSKCNIVVLDEVDRMLDMGFINDIRFILDKTATPKQSFFFSATLDSRVRSIIDTFSNNPVHITVKTGDTSENVHQNVVTYISKEEKIQKLHDLLTQNEVVKTLVFDDTHRSVEKLCKELQERGFDSDAIHGGKSQSQRQRALNRFKENHVTVLVATDVAARGIDVADITHVINYSTPQTYQDYVHRIGRAGRAGRQGHALTFIEK